MENKDRVIIASEQQAVEYINRCYHTEDDLREETPTVLHHIKHSSFTSLCVSFMCKFMCKFYFSLCTYVSVYAGFCNAWSSPQFFA